MYSWIIRVSAAAVGTVLLVMIKTLDFNPILYIFPVMLILFFFFYFVDDYEKTTPIEEDVRKVVIKLDNRQWDFADEECSRTSQTVEEKNQRNIKIGIGVR